MAELMENKYYPQITICSESTKVTDDEDYKNNATIRAIYDELGKKGLPRYKPSKAEEALLLPKKKHILLSCKFKTLTSKFQDCWNYLSEIQLEGYGGLKPCLTLNTAFPDAAADYDMREINITVRIPQCKNCQLVSMFLIIHQNGEFVNLKLSQYHQIETHPGMFYDVQFSINKVTRLAAPYVTNCTNDYSYFVNPLLNISILQEKQQHSYEKCLLECAEFASVKKKYVANLSNFDCGCRPPCNEHVYTFGYQITSNFNSEEMKLPNFTDYEDLYDYLATMPTVIRIRPASSKLRVMREKPAVETELVMGLFGGILGLWIGVSVVSLIVNVHKIIGTIYKNLRQRQLIICLRN